MDRTAFFDAIRPAFGNRLASYHVTGMVALLDAGADLPLHHMANVLAQVRRETGGIMAPIKETVQPNHADKDPPDMEVIRRLDRAYAAGKLPWVKSPYWRDGWFGRGQIQLTHRANYAKFGITKPADALLPHISAHVAVAGMRDGLFTGRKLADYSFPAALDAPPAMNPRRIVNGQDGSDAQVAKFHRQFAAALTKAGWGHVTVSDHPLTSKPVDVSETAKSEHQSPLARLLAWFMGARQ
jgi:predicted chitinase